MKTISIVPVLFLDVFAAEREMTTKNGTKIKRSGNLVFQQEVGGTRNVFLSAKQLDRQAAIAGVNRTGLPAWYVFKDLIGVGRTRAQVTVEDYKAGDDYLDTLTGEVKKHTVSGSNVSIDAIFLSDKVSEMKTKKAIELTNEWNQYAIPEVEAAPMVEVVPTGVN